MSCSPAVPDGTCGAACGYRAMRERHSNANSEVVSCTVGRLVPFDISNHVPQRQPLIVTLGKTLTIMHHHGERRASVKYIKKHMTAMGS